MSALKGRPLSTLQYPGPVFPDNIRTSRIPGSNFSPQRETEADNSKGLLFSMRTFERDAPRSWYQKSTISLKGLPY